MPKPEARNRRATPRHPFVLDATLMVSGQIPFPGRTRNISLGGAFIETHVARLPGRADGYLALALHLDGKTLHHRLPGRIVRQTELGVGLIFAHPGIDAIHALRKIIYPPPTQVLLRTHRALTVTGETR